MAGTGKRKAGGGKPSRTEAVGVRLDPKLKYLAELASRHQRRTLSSYIEWAIQDSLERIAPSSDGGDQTTLADVAHQLWDVDEADRFAKLALSYPHLLTHEEQVRWKLIREMPGLWRGCWMGAGATKEWYWKVDQRSMKFEQLRAHWAQLCAVAEGAEPRTNLPGWLLRSTAPESDDDVPF